MKNTIFQLPPPITVKKLTICLLDWYKQKSGLGHNQNKRNSDTSINNYVMIQLQVVRLEKFNIPLKPNALNRKLQLTLKIMKVHYPNFTDVHAMRLKQYVRKFTVQLHAHFCLKTKQAVPLSWPDARRLAKLLWLTTLDPHLIRQNSILLRKSAALALMFGTATGARWADIHRLRWEDVSKVNFKLVIKYNQYYLENTGRPKVHPSSCTAFKKQSE